VASLASVRGRNHVDSRSLQSCIALCPHWVFWPFSPSSPRLRLQALTEAEEYTPLMAAVRGKHKVIRKLLIEAGADFADFLA
jgi:Ankyrin repeat